MTSPVSVRSYLQAAFGCFALLLLTGCGEKLVEVKGTILNNQQPLTMGVVQVYLIPDVPPGTPMTMHPGRADATGNFTIEEKVKPGKYKIAVEHQYPLPGNDKLNGKFNAKNTKIVREVVDEKTPLTIDLAMP